MSRLRIAGIVAAFALAGCGDDSGVSEGTVPFKSGNVDQLNQLKNQMVENMKNKAHMKKSPAEDSKSGTESKPSGAAKPTTEGKAQEKKS
jgi:hypothetical protein